MNARMFHFDDGKSSKFWAIRVESKSHTVRFGRLGTDGQAQSKEFASETEAQQSAEKLIKEKQKKGYIEVTAAETATATTLPLSPIAEQDAPIPAIPAPSTAVPVSTSLQSGLERRLELDPSVQVRREETPTPPLPRPHPSTWDRKECLKRLANVSVQRWGNIMFWELHYLELADHLHPEEAQFWLNVYLSVQFRFPSSEQAASTLAGSLDPGPEFTEQLPELISYVNFRTAYHNRGRENVSALVKLLCSALPLSSVFDLLQNLTSGNDVYSSNYKFDCMKAFIELLPQIILPYLEPVEANALRAKLRPYVKPDQWSNTRICHLFSLANLLDMGKELLALVESWDSWYPTSLPPSPQEILFKYGNPDQLIYHFRRLSLKLSSPYIKSDEAVKNLHTWLAMTGFAALDVVRDTILGIDKYSEADKRKEAELMVVAFGKAVIAPETVGLMLEWMLSSKAPQAARQWLLDHPMHTVSELLPVVVGRGGGKAKAELDVIRSLAGHAQIIEEALQCLDAPTAKQLADEIFPYRNAPPEYDAASTPDWLKEALWTAPATSRAIGWLTPGELPFILVSGKRLSESQASQLLHALKQSPLDSPHPLIASLRQKAEPASLEQFCWALFERWLTIGAPVKEDWALFSLGHFGFDMVALKLAALIRIWPGENQHPRAVKALNCLKVIGSDTALMQINGIAQKVSFERIKTLAQDCLEAIARERNLSKAELEDRIIPDCGLDERGSRIFDFGSRQFQFVLGADLQPLVRDLDGKLKPNLPKANSKDDPEKATQAIAEWKLIKKQVGEVAKVQALRLEQAMVSGRCWFASEFEKLLVEHPLIGHLTRMLIWEGMDANGVRTGTFRVMDDRTFGDMEDNPCLIKNMVQIKIVHPLRLSQVEQAHWGQLLVDYNIMSPFAQIGRPIYMLEPGEGELEDIRRFEKVAVPSVTLVRTLENLGWRHGGLHDHGDYRVHWKYFPGADITACVGEWEDVSVVQGNIYSYTENLQRCCFVKGYHPEPYELPTDRWYRDHKKFQILLLGQVDPIVLSEVLKDLHIVAAKGA